MKYLSCLLLLFLVVKICPAQNTGVVVYEPFNATDSLNPRTDLKINQNALKWNLGYLGRGCFSFAYERSIISALSLELEAGLTYQDYIFEELSDLDAFETDYTDGENEINIGYNLAIALKYYPVEGDLEGLYFSPMIRYRTYNNQQEFELNNIISTYPNGYNMTDYAFVCGLQGGGWSDLTSEMYFGVSYRVDHVKQFNYINDNDGNRIGYDVQSITNKKPVLLFGYKIGYTF
ncbi:MAG: hypothetical protein JEZ09_12220 [Salinivirgaceae bacterium]|nr:hypothetical protein [Salinivirgaceae bacterium]